MPAAYVPMDGFHLADVTLSPSAAWTARARRTPSTPGGTPRCCGALREERDHVVYAPGFERDLEQPIAGALAVPPEAELVVTEGNYLLLDRPEWRAVRAELDEVVFLETRRGPPPAAGRAARGVRQDARRGRGVGGPGRRRQRGPGRGQPRSGPIAW